MTIAVGIRAACSGLLLLLASVPASAQEIVAPPGVAVTWVAASNGMIPPGAVPGGVEQPPGGEPLFVCRVRRGDAVLPGKIRPEFRGCNVGVGRSETMVGDYEVAVGRGRWGGGAGAGGARPPTAGCRPGRCARGRKAGPKAVARFIAAVPPGPRAAAAFTPACCAGAPAAVRCRGADGCSPSGATRCWFSVRAGRGGRAALASRRRRV